MWFRSLTATPASHCTSTSSLRLTLFSQLMHRPPFTWNYLEFYDDVCLCEAQLNKAMTPIEIDDVLGDCLMFYHRMADQGDMSLYDRVVDLECNIRCKCTRACSALLSAAAAMAASIHQQYFQHPPQSRLNSMQITQQDAESVVRQLDLHSHIFDKPMLSLSRAIRARLVWYLSIESSSDEELERQTPTRSC